MIKMKLSHKDIFTKYSLIMKCIDERSNSKRLKVDFLIVNMLFKLTSKFAL